MTAHQVTWKLCLTRECPFLQRRCYNALRLFQQHYLSDSEGYIWAHRWAHAAGASRDHGGGWKRYYLRAPLTFGLLSGLANWTCQGRRTNVGSQIHVPCQRQDLMRQNDFLATAKPLVSFLYPSDFITTKGHVCRLGDVIDFTFSQEWSGVHLGRLHGRLHWSQPTESAWWCRLSRLRELGWRRSQADACESISRSLGVEKSCFLREDFSGSKSGWSGHAFRGVTWYHLTQADVVSVSRFSDVS